MYHYENISCLDNVDSNKNEYKRYKTFCFDNIENFRFDTSYNNKTIFVKRNDNIMSVFNLDNICNIYCLSPLFSNNDFYLTIDDINKTYSQLIEFIIHIIKLQSEKNSLTPRMCNIINFKLYIYCNVKISTKLYDQQIREKCLETIIESKLSDISNEYIKTLNFGDEFSIRPKSVKSVSIQTNIPDNNNKSFNINTTQPSYDFTKPSQYNFNNPQQGFNNQPQHTFTNPRQPQTQQGFTNQLQQLQQTLPQQTQTLPQQTQTQQGFTNQPQQTQPQQGFTNQPQPQPQQGFTNQPQQPQPQQGFTNQPQHTFNNQPPRNFNNPPINQSSVFPTSNIVFNSNTKSGKNKDKSSNNKINDNVWGGNNNIWGSFNKGSS